MTVSKAAKKKAPKRDRAPARKRRISTLTMLRRLTPDELNRTTVVYRFEDGEERVSAADVKQDLETTELALRRIQGAQGGRPQKAPEDIHIEIFNRFTDDWLARSEHVPILRAMARARSRLVKELAAEYGERTAQRLVKAAIGAKERIPKRYHVKAKKSR